MTRQVVEGPAQSPGRDMDVECPACGAYAMRRFCGECGEERVVREDLSLRRFMRNAARSVSDLDSTLVRSLFSLVTRPGELAAEYYAGRRRAWMPPLRIFLLCNVAFFLLHAAAPINLFSTSLQDQLLNHPYSGLLRGLPAGDGLTFAEFLDAPQFPQYAQRYYDLTTTHAKTLVILMVPVFALLTLLPYGRHRRYYVEHLVFGLHVFAFLMLLTAVVGLGYHLAMAVLVRTELRPTWQTIDATIGLVMGACMIAYLAAAGPRAFGVSRSGALVRALLLLPCFILVIYVYRFILFFTTIAAL